MNGLVLPEGEVGEWICNAINAMDSTISETLESQGAQEEAELWQIHAEHINNVYKQGGKGRQGFKKVWYHPLLLNWAMAFLA